MEQTTSPSTAQAADDSTTIKLRKQLTVAGLDFTEMVIREPTAGQWKDVDDLTGVTADMKALSIVTGMMPAAVAQLSVRDFRAGVAALGRFFVDGESVDGGDDADDAVELDTETVIPLRTPVESDRVYAELRLREPTAAEWRVWSGLGGTAADIKAVATITGIPELAVEKLGIRDLRAAARWIGRFFVDAPAIGALS